MNTIIIYISVLALVSSVPMLLDICLAYSSRNKARSVLIEKATVDGLQPKERQEFITEIGKPPPGIPGLARAVMALTVIVILGVAVVHVLVNGVREEGGEIIENVLSMLAGLLAAITGFYFGGRTAQTSAGHQGPSDK